MATRKTAGSEPAGYAEAIAEVEAILRDLDSGTVDVDVLTVKVARAAELIDWCTARIAAVQEQVDDMVSGFEDADDDDTGDEV
ncbi:MAG: exodeoxyribonuclease VII small subunit [Acidimicrobiales bacterium]